MDVQDIVNTVSQKAGLDQATTEKVVGTIFSVLEHEAEGTSASSFFAKIPGADALAQKYDVLGAAPAWADNEPADAAPTMSASKAARINPRINTPMLEELTKFEMELPARCRPAV